MFHLQSGAFRVYPGFARSVVLADTTTALVAAADCNGEHGPMQPGFLGGGVTPPILFHEPQPLAFFLRRNLHFFRRRPTIFRLPIFNVAGKPIMVEGAF
jgi:hypothetical protein